MSPTGTEIDRIISDKIDENITLFLVRLKEPPHKGIKFWLPFNEIPSAGLIVKYVMRLISSLRSPDEVDHNFDRIFNILKNPVNNELNSLAKTFLTLRGLELPQSKHFTIIGRLRNMIRGCITDYEKLADIRRDILVEQLIEKRKQQLESLKMTEIHINIISDHQKPITVVNDYDLEKFPEYLRYINKQIFTSSEEKPDEVMVGCECKSSEDCILSSCVHYDYEKEFYFTTTKKVGGKQSKRVIVPYDEKGRSLSMIPKFECNENCKCDASCHRRVVQKGSNVQLEIFRTFTGYGWGVRTLEAIEKGTFVSKYAGEIILWEEANRRNCNEYLFDIEFGIDPDVGHAKYTVDAYKYGNISRFVNHNCKPNLSIQVVYIENISRQLGEICFFAARDIAANEELSINYKPLVLSRHGICKCSSCF